MADGGGPERFPCADCGAALAYAPGEPLVRCPYCGQENRIEDADGPWTHPVEELDFRRAVAAGAEVAEIEETRVIHCDTCGADVEFDPDLHADACPFCASPIVDQAAPNRHIRPSGVLPFELDEPAARKAMNDWLGSLWFAPSGLKAYARAGRPMQGVYIPYWTYDADTASRYRGQRGDVYYVTQRVRVVVDGKARTELRQVPKIRWSPAAGRVARFFDDVLVLASQSLPKAQADRLGPWDLSQLRPYQSAYLAGFRAEAYTVGLEDGFAEARQVMDETIVRDVRFAIGGDRQRIHDIDTDVRDVTFKHILLPVWLAAYRYGGKSYRFIVNGRTGAVQGERPYSTWKIAVAVVLGLIAAVAVGWVMRATQGY